MALDLDDLDGPSPTYLGIRDRIEMATFQLMSAHGRHLAEVYAADAWFRRLEKWREIAKAAGSPDPALGFLTRLGALVNALRSIERGYPWGSIQEDFVYAETGRAPR